MKKALLLLAIMAPSYIHTMELEQPKKKHIVYHPSYDITFFGVEKIHPFDSSKYSKVATALVASGTLTNDDFHQPTEISDKDLRLVHTPEYLDNLHHCASAMFTKASGVPPLFIVPNCLIRWRALYPMRLATGGTVEATQLALKNKWAINLSGGYHHAKTNDCDGFCIYNDAAVAAHKAINENNIKKILVIDLDAHQGNGNEAIFGTQETFKDKVDVFDMYGESIYPGTRERYLIAKAYHKTWYDNPLSFEISNEQYKQTLHNNLPTAIETTNPELIIYNAGSDIYEKDPLGHMKVTKQGIIDRDAYVFGLAKKKNIPIVMILSGGYTSESAEIITDSIQNIFQIMKENN